MDYWSSPQSFCFTRSGVGFENLHFDQVFRWWGCCCSLWGPLHCSTAPPATSLPHPENNSSFIHSSWTFYLPGIWLTKLSVIAAVAPFSTCGEKDAFYKEGPLKKVLHTLNALLIDFLFIICFMFLQGTAIQLCPNSWACPSYPQPLLNFKRPITWFGRKMGVKGP